MSRSRIRTWTGAPHVYLVLAVLIVAIALLLAMAWEIEPGWAPALLVMVAAVMVAHDAHRRGMTPLWGVFALTLIGAAIYLIRISRRPPDRFVR